MNENNETIVLSDEEDVKTVDTMEISEVDSSTARSFMSTPIDEFTVTEGLLLILVVLFVFNFVFNLVRNIF